jgi:uncharacterized protein YpmB
MPEAARAEVYFIAAMMVIILVVCGLAVYFFFKTLYKEKRETAARIAKKDADARAEPAGE